MTVPATNAPSDDLLVRRFLRGDESAFRTLHERHAPHLRALVRRILGADHADLDDVVQDTWLACCRGMKSFRGDASFFTWLAAVGIRAAYRRSLRREETSDAMPEDLPAVTPDAVSALDIERALTRGALIRTMGRAGRGPGEFELPNSMAVWRDGSVAIHDAARRVFINYDGTGKHLFDRERRTGLGAPARIFPLRGRSVVGKADVYYAGGTAMAIRDGGPQAIDRMPVQMFAMNATTAPALIYAARYTPAVRRTTDGDVRVGFVPDVHVAVTPGGDVLIADSTTYEISVIRPGSGVTQRLRRAIPPRAVTEPLRSSERERLRKAFEGVRPSGGGGAPMTNRARDEADIRRMEFAREMPVIRRLSVDWSARIWIERDTPAGTAGAVDILSEAGSYVGTLTRVPQPAIAAFGPRDLVAQVRLDDADVPMILIGKMTIR